MKHRILIVIMIVFFVGCGGSSNNVNSTSNPLDTNDENSSLTEDNSSIDTDNNTPPITNIEDNSLDDIILRKSQSKVCTKESTFVVEPTDNPKVKFYKDMSSGDINVTVSSDSKGFITIENCTSR